MTIKLGHVEGHQIAYRVFNGDAENIPIVCIHGITSSVDFWTAGQNEWVAADKKWISLSLPGHFPSTFPDNFKPEQLTAEMVTTVLWEALEQIVGDQPVILGGHSTGGFSAVAMAATKPDRVHGLFSISGFAHGKWDGALALLQRFARGGALGRMLFKNNFRFLSLNQAFFNAAIRFYTADNAAFWADEKVGPTLDMTYPHYQQLDLDAMLAWFRRMPDIDVSDQLAKITVPTLVIHGQDDPIVPFAQGKLIAETVANGRLVPLEGCGHLPMGERGEQYEAALVPWWQEMLA